MIRDARREDLAGVVAVIAAAGFAAQRSFVRMRIDLEDPVRVVEEN